jgi:hypothetical protein
VTIAREVLSFYYEPDKRIYPAQGEINLAGMARVTARAAGLGLIAVPTEPGRIGSGGAGRWHGSRVSLPPA